jgi:cytochrome b involved in lipid metabolism
MRPNTNSNTNTSYNNTILPLTDSSDESSIDRNRGPSRNIQISTPNPNISMITTATALSFEEDGSVVVDLTDDVEDVRRYPEHRLPSGPATRAIVNESDIVVPPNHHTNNGISSYPPKRTRNHRWLPVVLGMAVLLSFILGIIFFLQSKKKSTSSLSNKSVENPTPITQQELALHSDATNDCWILIDDTVYDVTQYAPKHPGGPQYITDFCGSNATKDFYINHPKEYLNIYLSFDTRKGVLSTNSNTTKTTTGGSSSSSSKNNNNNSNNASTNNNSTTSGTANGVNEKDNSGNNNDDKNDDDGSGNDDGNDDSTWAPTTVPIDNVVAPTGATTSPPATASCISIDEVALHSSSTDCYYILYNYVYDFTNYIDLHPGGARKVFQECGTDATAVFITQKFHNEDLLLQVNALDLYGLGNAC